MSAELPQLRVQRQIKEGKGQVSYTFAPGLLSHLLEQEGVSEPSDLPQDLLRDLCRRACHAEIQRSMEDAEQQHTGGTAVVIGDERGTAEVRSSDLGFDNMMRLAPESDNEMDMLCDPQYSPVEFDLRVFDAEQEGADPAQNLGRSVLRVTLEPPSLA